jgi:hypothetical protein
MSPVSEAAAQSRFKFTVDWQRLGDSGMGKGTRRWAAATRRISVIFGSFTAIEFRKERSPKKNCGTFFFCLQKRIYV